MVTKPKYTWYDMIIHVLETVSRKPLQRKDLLVELLKLEKTFNANVTIDDLHLGLALNQLSTKDKLAMYKFPGFPAFYAIPSWMKRDGGLKEEFDIDPYTKKLKNGTENHAA